MTQVDTQRTKTKQKLWGRVLAGSDGERLAVKWGKGRGDERKVAMGPKATALL